MFNRTSSSMGRSRTDGRMENGWEDRVQEACEKQKFEDKNCHRGSQKTDGRTDHEFHANL